ncbi:MAG: DMT family transporter [Frankiaceae bacterium]|nr:DMT family transporter [Arenimonas sp.]
MTASRRAHWQIHFCVLLWGFTAILGKLITLTALALVWWRMLLVTFALLLVPRVWRGLRGLPTRLLASYAGVGVLVALHWLTFYGSIKLANASVAVTCIALAPVFLALVEPAIAGRRMDPRELVLGIAVVPGVALVVGGVPAGMHWGIVVGVASALLVALFGAYNKRLVEHADPLTVTCVELGSGMVFLGAIGLPLAWLGLVDSSAASFMPGARDAVYLLILAMACTLLPFALSLAALRNLSAFQAQLAVNLEPVYAIALAIVLLDEQRELGMSFYLGVAIILLAVFIHPIMVRPRSPPSPLATSG